MTHEHTESGLKTAENAPKRIPKPRGYCKRARARALRVLQTAAAAGDVAAARALLELASAAERDAHVAAALRALADDGA